MRVLVAVVLVIGTVILFVRGAKALHDRSARRAAAAQKRETLKGLVNVAALKDGRRTPFAVAPLSEGDAEAANVIRTLLPQQIDGGAGLADGFFLSGFERTPFFQQAFAGDLSALQGVGVMDGVRALFLATAHVECVPVETTTSCEVAIDYRLLGEGGVIATDRIALTKNSSSRGRAVREATELLLEKHRSELARQIAKGGA